MNPASKLNFPGNQFYDAKFVVDTLADSGDGSLREAIESVNASAPGTSSVVYFSISGTIGLASDLPALARTVAIDATSAPDHTDGGAPVVAIDCGNHAGLVFAPGSDYSQLLGLAIGNAGASGVTLEAGSITLGGNYIGLDLTGAALPNTGDGVCVAGSSSGNQIGFNPTAAPGVVSNVISGNGGNGIALHGSSGNILVNNYVGTDPRGMDAIANGGNGIWLTAGSTWNTIGGIAYTDTVTCAVNDPTGDKGKTAPVFVVPPLGNLVSGNRKNGILIDANSQYNVLNGNFVGTTADGDKALGNAGDGVRIDEGADNNSLIGCTFEDNPFVYYNVVSGNGGNGLHVTDSNNTTVQANFFGISADNESVVGNALNGILADGSSQIVTIGGVIPLGNVCAGNGQNGIEVRDRVSGFITFNTFGGLFAFGKKAPNENDGLLITAIGGNQRVRTNVFSGNIKHGIEISGDASGVTVVPNIVGLDTIGDKALPNGGNGIEINGTAHDNVIGGTQSSVIPQNTFSGNGGYGVAIRKRAHDNQVFGCFIGTNVSGSCGMGNRKGGVLIGGNAKDNTIGGLGADGASAGNLISGNRGDGVTLKTGTSGSQILDNWIGFDREHLPLLPNTGEPTVENGSTGNTIEGNFEATVVVTDPSS